MGITVFFINTITGIENTFNSLCDEIITGKITKKHISDESIITQILAAGGITKHVRKRFFENVISAEQAGADIIQVTCSSVTPIIPCAAQLVDVPLLSVDRPMAESAVSRFGMLGLMATNPGTLVPSRELLLSTAEKGGRKIILREALCKGAYDALLEGRKEVHDRIILEELENLMEEVDAVVLAQASMARVAEMMDKEKKTKPVLTSPEMAVRHLAKTIENL